MEDNILFYYTTDKVNEYFKMANDNEQQIPTEAVNAYNEYKEETMEGGEE